MMRDSTSVFDLIDSVDDSQLDGMQVVNGRAQSAHPGILTAAKGRNSRETTVARLLNRRAQ